MSGHGDPAHADHDAHHPLNPHHHDDHGHEEKAHAGDSNEVKTSSGDQSKPSQNTASKNHISTTTDVTTHRNPHRVETRTTSDERSSLTKGATTIYNTTAGAIVDTAINIGHAGINTAVRTTAGTVSGIRDTIKQTAHEIQDNFSTASHKDKWYKRWAGYLGSTLSIPGIALEGVVRTASEPLNTAKSLLNIGANTVTHQAKTIKAMGTSIPPLQVNTDRARETREQPSRRKEKFWLNPRHRYNKVSGWFGKGGHTTSETPKTGDGAHH